MGRRAGVSIKTTIYQGFKGVDFSTDPSLVDKRRSPLATNMIADSGGMPEKRLGWRVLHRMNGQVHDLFYGVFEGETKYLAHVGKAIYEWTDDPNEEPFLLLDGLTEERGAAASLQGKLWILAGGAYLVYDGETLRKVSEDAYAPTTVIDRAPSGGGSTYESMNLVGRYRKNEFIPDGTAKEYVVDGDIDAEGPVTVTVWGEEKAEGTDFTVNRENRTVTFSAAPAKAEVGVEGAVIIKFPCTPEGYEDKIARCRIMTSYGVGSNDRLFFAGNPDFPNVDWHSGLNDPTYVPDLSYATVGIEATAIMGYLRVGEYLAVVKEDNGQDSTIFLRSGSLDESGQAVFSLRQSVAGVGAVARGTFGSLLDDPLFLSGTGVCAVSTNMLTTEKIAQNRSFYVNAKLVNEPGLENAVATQWMGMYVLCVNGNVYVLDGRQQKTYRSESLGDFVYECYFWDNVPAVSLMRRREGDEEMLYFGTADGRICRFNTDVETLDRFSDDGEAIDAVWATKADDDGDPSLLKTMIKKGNCVTLKPYNRSSAEICFRTDRDTVDWLAKKDTIDIFDWGEIDFSRLSFDSNDGPREIMFQTKVKKYKRLQILIRNKTANEGFGVFGIVKHYVVGNFAKQ